MALTGERDSNNTLIDLRESFLMHVMILLIIKRPADFIRENTIQDQHNVKGRMGIFAQYQFSPILRNVESTIYVTIQLCQDVSLDFMYNDFTAQKYLCS